MGADVTGDRAIVIAALQAEVRQVNETNGWFDADRSFGDGIALLHTEVSEAFEAYRDWGLEDATAQRVHLSTCGSDLIFGVEPPCGCPTPKPEGVGSEYADILIRLLDQCERDGIDLVAETERKLAYNRTRGYRHGGRSV